MITVYPAWLVRPGAAVATVATRDVYAIRSTDHGFALLQESDGFQWSADPADTFDWMIQLIDRGLRAGR